MDTVFTTRKKISKKTSAFSLLELLIVIAIISILIGAIMVRHHKIRTGQMVEQCRSNIWEMASSIEAYKLSNGFYPCKDDRGVYYGASTFRIISIEASSQGPLRFLNSYLVCPLGPKYFSADSTIGGTEESGSYGFRIREEEYSIKCFSHNLKATVYQHLKGEAYGSFNQDWSSRGALAY